MRAKELTIGTDYLVSDPNDWVAATWGVHYYRLVDERPWADRGYGAKPAEAVTFDGLTVRVPGEARVADSWAGASALMVPVNRDGEVRVDDDGTVLGALVSPRTVRTTREDGLARRTEHGARLAEDRRRAREAKATDAERAEGVMAALGRGTFVPGGNYVGTVHVPTVTLTLDEATDVATRLGMLRRAAVAEVYETIRTTLLDALPIAPSDPIIRTAAEAVVANLTALDEAVGA